ncbi:MAG: phosphotransferase enzyme family protein [Bilifractor sp.]
MTALTSEQILSAIHHFDFPGQLESFARYGHGHINDTYLLQLRIGKIGTMKVILQRINTDIFQNPRELMENICNVTMCLQNKIQKAGGDAERETLNVITDKQNQSYYRDPRGNCWRAYKYITDACTYDQPLNVQDFYQSAVAFGRFQNLLSDYPADHLYETIPDFHNTLKRYNYFEKSLKEDKLGRANTAVDEIAFVKEHQNLTTLYQTKAGASDIPLRVVHNDTKLNNIMIDNLTHQGICIIDLDTVMPGYVMNDFGDSIRFGASTALEDETDLSKVNLDISAFEAYTKGFMEQCSDKLTELETSLLADGARIMTYECGMRFLTDYLDGDKYFRIARPNHNLERARNQFALLKDMDQKIDEMKAIVEKYR